MGAAGTGLTKRKSFVKEKDKEPEDDPNRNEDEHPLRIGEKEGRLSITSRPLVALPPGL